MVVIASLEWRRNGTGLKMNSKRRSRRHGLEFGLTGVHGIGLHSLTELRPQRSTAARWWSTRPVLAKVALVFLFGALGLAVISTLLLAIGDRFLS